MLVNLTEILTSDGKVVKASYPIDMTMFIYNGEEYSIVDKSAMQITFTNTGKQKLVMEGSTAVTLAMFCDRCLKPVEVPVKIFFAHEINSNSHISDTEEAEEYSFLQEYTLDTEELLRYELVVNMPMKVLCEEDCQGICLQCGNDLNEKSCGCDPFVPDPRMAAIKDIFNANNKEV